MTGRNTSLTLAAGLALVAGLLSGGAATATPRDQAMSPPAWAVPTLDWADCAQGPAGMQCATAEVPTSYRRPGGPTTSIAMVRLPAANPGQRIGSLFVNPGGPGASGTEFVSSLGAAAFSQDVLDRYDVIGFDPRGVGASDPAMCFGSMEEELAAFAPRPAFPVTRAEVPDYIALTTSIMASCKANADERFSHASTANVARDLDLMRRAVGDTKLHYVGYSYGTFLGATYAKLFPQRVGRMVMDGTIDPDVYTGRNGDRRSVGARLGQASATQDVFENFLDLCRAAADRCALNALGDPETVMDAAFESLKTTPVTVDLAGIPTEINYSYAVVLAFQGMYSPGAWPGVARLLTRIATAQPSSRMVGQAPAEDRPSYPSIGGGLASMCVDMPTRIRPHQFARLADAEDRKVPHFGRFRTWAGLECATTRFVDRDAYRGTWKQTTRQNVLVIGTRHDPATPYGQAKTYAKTFPRASLLTVEGYGHTSLLKSTCADDVITTYLVDGRAPARGATCNQDLPPFPPAGGTTRETQPSPLMPTF